MLGGEIGVCGFSTTGFVWFIWWYGGEAGEKEPEWRGRFKGADICAVVGSSEDTGQKQSRGAAGLWKGRVWISGGYRGGGCQREGWLWAQRAEAPDLGSRSLRS
jgi:hypothetical protein